MGKAVALLLLVPLIGCTSTKCRRYNDLDSATKTKWVGSEADPALTAKVMIFKDDGSLQCGMGQAISADTMQKELGGIKVFKAENRSDGLMHTQACGTPTGRINVYEIRQVDVDKASKKGFKVLQQ